jgi:hypothetical protein
VVAGAGLDVLQKRQFSYSTEDFSVCFSRADLNNGRTYKVFSQEIYDLCTGW